MEQACNKCKNPILHIPLLCEICDVPLCLQCADDVTLCDSCVNVQMAMAVDAKKIKCSDPNCEEWAIVNQTCSSIVVSNGPKVRRQRRRIVNNKPDYVKCSEDVTYCAKHIKRCQVCKNIICMKCYDRGGCWKDCVPCGFCFERYETEQMKTCTICNKFACKICVGKKFDVSTGNEIYACGEHRKECDNCKKSLYHTPILQCDYVDAKFGRCNMISCRSGWFQSFVTQKVIHACHNHICVCFLCDLMFPATNARIIKFRGGLIFHICSNCYKLTQMRIDLLLVHLKRSNISMPRDVIALILGSLFSDEVKKY